MWREVKRFVGIFLSIVMHETKRERKKEKEQNTTTFIKVKEREKWEDTKQIVICEFTALFFSVLISLRLYNITIIVTSQKLDRKGC